MRALQLVGQQGVQGLEADLALPLIETLHWEVEAISTEELAAVLQCLPNLTAFCHTMVYRGVIDISTIPRLAVLTVVGNSTGSIFPFTGSCPQLQELRIGSFQLTDERAGWLVQCCPNIQLLEVSMHDTDVNHLLRLLQTNLCLEELVLHNIELNKVSQVAALPNIRRLTFTGQNNIFGSILNVFIDMLGRYPHLECLRTDDVVCSRKVGQRSVLAFQTIESFFMTPEEMSGILSKCSPVEVFSFYPILQNYVADFLSDKFDEALKALAMWTNERHVLYTMLSSCGWSLRSLDLNWECEEEACPLEYIARSCPGLTKLSLHFGEYTIEPQEYSFTALFEGCKSLEEFSLEHHRMDVDRVALRAIIQCKLRLKVLKLVRGFEESDGVWFRQQIRDQQLLPLPAILFPTGDYVLYDGSEL